MTQEALRRRYNYLWSGEAVAATLFVILFLWAAYQDGVWQRWIIRGYSLAVVVTILIQGTCWWRLKLQLLNSEERHLPSRVLESYRNWRRINWVLIGAFPFVAVAATRLTRQPLVSVDTGIGLLILGGALLEQINYYYVQLMYDSPYDWHYLRRHRRLRQGTIACALKKNKIHQ
jgi:hypothetical protein